jgi:hypothetical protein
MAFVGMEIRTSNVQARAAAYQAIGIATSEFHRYFDARLNRLATESAYPEAVRRWTLADWESDQRMTSADLRMLETILLQVEQGLLPPDAMARLGYDWGPVLSEPDFACLWPMLSGHVGASVRQLIEDSTPEADRFVCQVDLNKLRDETILGKAGNEGEGVASLLVGTWIVKSVEITDSAGRVSQIIPSAGMLIYTSDGHMAVQDMELPRPTVPQVPEGPDKVDGWSPEQVRRVVETYDAYYGTYEIDEGSQIVTHHVEGELRPNLVGADYRRHYEIEGDRLVLSSTQPDQHWRVNWERKSNTRQ